MKYFPGGENQPVFKPPQKEVFNSLLANYHDLYSPCAEWGNGKRYQLLNRQEFGKKQINYDKALWFLIKENRMQMLLLISLINTKSIEFHQELQVLLKNLLFYGSPLQLCTCIKNLLSYRRITAILKFSLCQCRCTSRLRTISHIISSSHQ